jgi:hypothetical protein
LVRKHQHVTASHWVWQQIALPVTVGWIGRVVFTKSRGKLAPEWIGTDAKADIPLPDNVRRYYVASTTHGGGAGGFNSSLAAFHQKATSVRCPGNNWGVGVLPANPASLRIGAMTAK